MTNEKNDALACPSSMGVRSTRAMSKSLPMSSWPATVVRRYDDTEMFEVRETSL
jgi:hypothetical protein